MSQPHEHVPPLSVDTLQEELLKRQLEELDKQVDILSAPTGKGAKAAAAGGKVRVKTPEEEEKAAAAKLASERAAAKPAVAVGGAGTGEASSSSAAAGAADEEDTDEARVKRLREEESHLFSKQPALEDVQKRRETWRDKLSKLELEIRNKEENKEVALGTSKINYMDPRISVAWCKRVQLPVERVFPKTLIAKFPWAMDAPSTFVF